MDIIITILSVFIAYFITILEKSLYAIPRKLAHKVPEEETTPYPDEFFRIILTYLFVIIEIYIEAVTFKYYVSSELMNTIYYVLLLYVSIVLVILCYSSFDYGKLFVPKLCHDKNRVNMRKLALYILISFFVICRQYFKYIKKIDIKIFEDIDGVYITGIFAFERIANLIYELKSREWEKYKN